MQDALRHTLSATLETAVRNGVTPGGVLVVSDNDSEGGDSIAFGYTHKEPHEPSSAVFVDTVYDIASLTKPIATTAVVMKLVAAGSLDIDEPAMRWLPELTIDGGGAISARHLLGHAAGFPDHIDFYLRLRGGDLVGKQSPRDAIVAMAGSTELVTAPGQRTRYSDLGFILLGALVERVASARLDALTREHVTGPMAMTSTFFVDLDEQWRPQGVAPTEHDDRRGLVCGEVHDENAHAAGGICGHAGLFAPAGDVARFAGAMCSTAAGTPTAGFDPATVRAFFDTPPVGGSNWRLGWDTPSASLSHAGDLWPRTGVGHLAFTGCSMWLDPPRERYVVLLTNRVHPTRQQGGIRDLRRQVMDTVAATWNMTR